MVLRAQDEQELLTVLAAAQAVGVPSHCILEETVSGSGWESAPRERVILAVGPAPAELITAITQQLQLL